MIAQRVRIVGHVQGVFFRAWTKEQADRLGIAGWVRNCEDGSVEAQLEGNRERVERIVELMKRGPQQARVGRLDLENAEVEGFDRFTIL